MRIMGAMRFCGRFRVRQTSLAAAAHYLGRNNTSTLLLLGVSGLRWLFQVLLSLLLL